MDANPLSRLPGRATPIQRSDPAHCFPTSEMEIGIDFRPEPVAFCAAETPLHFRPLLALSGEPCERRHDVCVSSVVKRMTDPSPAASRHPLPASRGEGSRTSSFYPLAGRRWSRGAGPDEGSHEKSRETDRRRPASIVVMKMKLFAIALAVVSVGAGFSWPA